MPTVNPSPFGPKPQFEIAAGTPAVGNKLFFYVGGSVNTKRNTYTDSTGAVANPNPIVLNSLGQPTNEIWFESGLLYKVVYAPSTDPDPPTSPIWSVDNIRGINDTTVGQDQWVASGLTPTFINTTSFSLAGDQTANFHIGRRLKTTNSGGTIYSRITNSVFGALTTVTVVNDSGVLDSGLSAVSYGLLSATNSSIPGVTMSGANWTITGTLNTTSVTVTGGGGTDATMSKGAVQGLVLQAATGSSYDYSLVNPGNTLYIVRVLTGTQNMEFLGTLAGFGSIKSNHATGGIGYTTGAGGTVTQLTNKGTGVTINKATGLITMNAAALADTASIAFDVNNTAFDITDAVIANHQSGGTLGGYIIQAEKFAANSFQIRVKNVSGGPLSEAIILRYAIIKGVSA